MHSSSNILLIEYRNVRFKRSQVINLIIFLFIQVLLVVDGSVLNDSKKKFVRQQNNWCPVLVLCGRKLRFGLHDKNSFNGCCVTFESVMSIIILSSPMILYYLHRSPLSNDFFSSCIVEKIGYPDLHTYTTSR